MGEDIEPADRPSGDDQRPFRALAQRVDAMTGELRQTGRVLEEQILMLRQEVNDLRNGIGELLHRTRPIDDPPVVRTPPVVKEPPPKLRDAVYLVAGLAVAAAAGLLTLYLFTRT